MGSVESDSFVQNGERGDAPMAMYALSLMLASYWASWLRALWRLSDDQPHHEGHSQLEVPLPFESGDHPSLFA